MTPDNVLTVINGKQSRWMILQESQSPSGLGILHRSFLGTYTREQGRGWKKWICRWKKWICHPVLFSRAQRALLEIRRQSLCHSQLPRVLC